MLNRFYFCCSYPLDAGSIVKPGNWSRILKKYTPQNGNPWILVREMIFEKVRVDAYPNKPSRFDSIFLCESESDIKEFISSNQRIMDIPYEVELINESLAKHRACLMLSGIDNHDNYEHIESKARMYWSGNNINKVEIVTTSPVKIIRPLNA